jgi:hypothetical protein
MSAAKDAAQFPEMRRRGFFDDLPTGSIEELRDWEPTSIQELGFDTADAQHIVAALDRQTEQLRIANLIAFEVISGEKNRAEIRKGLSL